MLVGQYGKPQRIVTRFGNGPAYYYDFPGFQGSIGFISAIAKKFCGNCNRARITAEGKLKLCLNYNEGINLKFLIREGVLDRQLGGAFAGAIFRKPRRHNFYGAPKETVGTGKMVQIGG